MAKKSFPPLNLPPLTPVLDADGNIFDPLRGKFVALTPEEWVRQHFVAWMIAAKGYPRALMANEVALRLNTTLRRCDTVVYRRRGGMPLMVVEYKAPGVAITQKVFDQICRYNIVMRTPWLVVSNGVRHYCCRIDCASGKFAFVPQMPDYSEIAD